MTFSEFGRTSFSNDGSGTDHGTSAPHFVFGSNVRGGMYGQRPTLRRLQRWERMAHHVDFRDYYGSVLDGWMGGGGADVLGAVDRQPRAVHRRVRAASSAGGRPDDRRQSGSEAAHQLHTDRPPAHRRHALTTSAVTAQARPGETMVSRHGRSEGRPELRHPIGDGERHRSRQPRETYLMVYPRGGTSREASNLNPSSRADRATRCHGVNKSGEFESTTTGVAPTASSTSPATAPSQVRSRSRSIAVLGCSTPATASADRRPRCSAVRRIDLLVAGGGGIPKTGVDAVVLNITSSTRPTVDRHRPLATGPPSGVSNVQLHARYIISNLVMSKVGSDGRCRIFSTPVRVDLVADVVGYYGADGAQTCR